MFHNYSLDKRAIPIATISTMVSSLSQQGYSADDILKDTGITELDLQDESLRVSYRQRIQQLNNVINLADDPGFWLDWETHVSISDFGLLGYAMMSSATLARAIQIAVKYHKMAGAMYELRFLVEDRDAVLRLDQVLTDGEAGHFMVEELFRGITPLISLLTGKSFSPRAIKFSYQPTATMDRYRRAFDCPLAFGQAFSEYRFDAGLLGRKLARADSSIAESSEAACRRLLQQMEIEEDLISRICRLLLSTPGEFPKLGAIATLLSMGTRTLRRRLKGLGTSYQRVLDDVKKELAIEYLQTTSLSVQEISDLLGYSEVTNFRRAFVKWVDLSPYQYRKQL